ncbi:MAG: class I SAM-dependent methyltransferase [Pseudonocardiales bacterium]|nr:class I SAM-dependent methyltransferase [Pseudonocardiales bacterium]
MVIDPRAATGFTAAEDYERGRPGYPPDAIERVTTELRLDQKSTVLDLAAGTGKLARLLRDRVGELVAVEMRAQLAARLPEVTLLDGTAEGIPLAHDTVDAVFVGEAFHWFDVAAAAGEIARVLRARGGPKTHHGWLSSSDSWPSTRRRQAPPRR